MATFEGSIPTPEGYFNMKVEYTYEQNIENNTTTIKTITGYVKRNRSTVYPHNSTSYSRISIDRYTGTGNNYENVATLESTYPYNLNHDNYVPFVTGSDIVIPHLPSGDEVITIEFYMDGKLSSYYPIGTIVEYINLPTIPRATPTTNLTGTIGQTAKITISPYSTSFNHQIILNFGSDSDTITMGVGVTEVNYTIPTKFYQQIPNSKSGTGSITVKTYNGSTLIGESTGGSLTLYANYNDCAPDFDIEAYDYWPNTTILTGSNKKVIPGFSKLYVGTKNALFKQYATFKSAVARVGSKTSNLIYTGAGVYSDQIGVVDSSVVEITLTDSRDYSIKKTSYSLTKVNYTPLWANVTISRPTPTGNSMNLKIDGEYWQGNFGATTNSLEVKWRVKLDSGEYSSWKTVYPTLSGSSSTKSISYNSNILYPSTTPLWNYAKSYTFEVSVKDKLVTINPTIVVSKGMPVYYWYEKNDKNHFVVNGDTMSEDYIIKNNSYKVSLRGLFEKIPAGEFEIWSGDKYFKENGTWEGLCKYYYLYERINDMYPEIQGFTRKFKLWQTCTNNLTSGYTFVKFSNSNDGSSSSEYTFPYIWGYVNNFDRTTQQSVEEFNIEALPKNAHTRIEITPMFAATDKEEIVYRLHLQVFYVME